MELRRLFFMKKLKKSVFLLMTSMICILSISISVQAEEIAASNSNNIANIMPRTDINYSTPALINDNDVPLRETPSLSGEVLMTLQQGYFVQINTENAIEADGKKWYPCKYGYLYGYVDAQYVRMIATA